MQNLGFGGYVFTGAVIMLALVIRLRRMSRLQRLRVELLWIIPAIFLLFAAVILVEFPPVGFGWLWLAIGFASGGAIGWQRGRLIEISVDRDTGRLYQRSSPTAILFLIALLLIRWVLRSLVMMGDARWHLGAMMVSSIFVVFAAGVLSGLRVELYLRARKLLRSNSNPSFPAQRG